MIADAHPKAFVTEQRLAEVYRTIAQLAARKTGLDVDSIEQIRTLAPQARILTLRDGRVESLDPDKLPVNEVRQYFAEQVESSNTKYDTAETVVGAGGSPDATAVDSVPLYVLDGSSAACTLDLLADPLDLQRVRIICIDSTNTCTAGRNGKQIGGDSVDLTFSKGESADLVCLSATGSWWA